MRFRGNANNDNCASRNLNANNAASNTNVNNGGSAKTEHINNSFKILYPRPRNGQEYKRHMDALSSAVLKVHDLISF